MQELCLLCGSHKTRTTPYHPESDGMVERFNMTLLMMLAMFAGKNRDDWDDLLPAVMMAYRSSVHESIGFSPYRLMFGEECTLPMDIGLPKEQSDTPDSITSPYALTRQKIAEQLHINISHFDYICLVNSIPRETKSIIKNYISIPNSGDIGALVSTLCDKKKVSTADSCTKQ